MGYVELPYTPPIQTGANFLNALLQHQDLAMRPQEMQMRQDQLDLQKDMFGLDQDRFQQIEVPQAEWQQRLMGGEFDLMQEELQERQILNQYLDEEQGLRLDLLETEVGMRDIESMFLPERLQLEVDRMRQDKEFHSLEQQLFRATMPFHIREAEAQARLAEGDAEFLEKSLQDRLDMLKEERAQMAKETERLGQEIDMNDIRKALMHREVEITDEHIKELKDEAKKRNLYWEKGVIEQELDTYLASLKDEAEQFRVKDFMDYWESKYNNELMLEDATVTIREAEAEIAQTEAEMARAFQALQLDQNFYQPYRQMAYQRVSQAIESDKEWYRNNPQYLARDILERAVEAFEDHELKAVLEEDHEHWYYDLLEFGAETFEGSWLGDIMREMADFPELGVEIEMDRLRENPDMIRPVITEALMEWVSEAESEFMAVFPQYLDRYVYDQFPAKLGRSFHDIVTGMGLPTPDILGAYGQFGEVPDMTFPEMLGSPFAPPAWAPDFADQIISDMLKNRSQPEGSILGPFQNLFRTTGGY